MRRRCFEPTHPSYPDYGGRGITVCARWLKFENFLADMGQPPAGHSIDRIDNNGGYAPGNCVWAAPKQQMNNRRINRLLTFKGKTATVAQWAEEIGITQNTLDTRLRYGWTVERALTTPLQKTDLTLNGETLSIVQWAARTGISEKTIRRRLDHDGWPVERALTVPARKSYPR